LSASTSCKQRALAVLEAARRGDILPEPLIHALGEECPGEFFRIVIESLADSFDPAQAVAYKELMRAWIAEPQHVEPAISERVDTVYVLSRVTLGADIKITSVILDAMKRRFPRAGITLVGGRKSAELFAADARVSHLEAQYPRSGPVSLRLEFAYDLERKLRGHNRIVVDPDSRMTQLGLAPVCELQHAFHFPSRTAHSAGNLTALTEHWVQEMFHTAGQAYVKPHPVRIEGETPRAAVSLGVGENDTKRVEGDFEAQMIRKLGERFRTIWIDRGVGGEEAVRVTAAARASGVADRVRFCEGSFADFVSVITQCDFYAGYDSAGQHAAAASGVPLISIFAGAPSGRFRERWAPSGPGHIHIVDATALDPAACLARFAAFCDDEGGGYPKTPG
jgi:ADP-heptose:LPS heptosyltransferase